MRVMRCCHSGPATAPHVSGSAALGLLRRWRVSPEGWRGVRGFDTGTASDSMWNYVPDLKNFGVFCTYR